MTLRDLRYLIALAEYRHYGRAAAACGISQPTLSLQIRRLEESLGVTLFERSPRRVVPTPICEQMLEHARRALAEAEVIAALAANAANPLGGQLRLGVIPTLGPYLLPLIFGPLHEALPHLALEPWEDLTAVLVERLRAYELDAALLASEVEGGDFCVRSLFVEPFLAALPPDHPLAAAAEVAEEDLAADVLVLADGHCLRDQALAACGLAGPRGSALRASSLATLINMVAAGYGTTLVPGLAAGAAEDAGLVLRPLKGRVFRTIRMVWRASFPRRAVVEAVAEVIAGRLRRTPL